MDTFARMDQKQPSKFRDVSWPSPPTPEPPPPPPHNEVRKQGRFM